MVIGTFLLGALKLGVMRATKRHVMEAIKHHKRMPREIPMHDDQRDDMPMGILDDLR